MAAAIVALPAVQLIPLPPQIWIHIPGRELLAQADLLSGNTGTWRPLSLTPEETLNALFATTAPLAVLILGVRLSETSRQRLLALAVALAALSAAVGFLQSLGDRASSLYFYDVTNRGSAVGLFANRNHQALLLAMTLPMLAAFYVLAPQRRTALSSFGNIAAVGMAFCLVPLILVTGSRLGMVAAAIGLAMAVVIVRGAERERRLDSLPLPLKRVLSALVAVLIVGLIVVTVWSGRGTALERLVGSSAADEMRLLILPSMFAMIGTYFPLGSGMGSFERIYQIHEPDALLVPTYLNHAHNDWLEVLLTAGVAGGLLLAAGVVAYIVAVSRAFSTSLKPVTPESEIMSRLGLVLIGLMGLGSIVDYPLRTPSLAALFVVAAIWASRPRAGNRPFGPHD